MSEQSQRLINDESDDGFYGSDRAQEQDNEEEEVQQKVLKKSKHPKKNKGIRKGRKERKSSNQKQKKEEVFERAARREVEEILHKMDKVFEEDNRLITQDKPASRKLSYCSQLEKDLKNVYICEQFLEAYGLLKFERWLQKLPNGLQPSLTLKKKIFNILLSMNVREVHISKAPQLQKIIQKNKRSITKDLRELSESILMKWERTCYEDK